MNRLVFQVVKDPRAGGGMLMVEIDLDSKALKSAMDGGRRHKQYFLKERIECYKREDAALMLTEDVEGYPKIK